MPRQGRVSPPPEPSDMYSNVSASPFGLVDLVGNVWQYTADKFQDEHTRFVLLKGGSSYQLTNTSMWYFPTANAIKLNRHSKYFLFDDAYERAATIGFRCVYDKDMNKEEWVGVHGDGKGLHWGGGYCIFRGGPQLASSYWGLGGSASAIWGYLRLISAGGTTRVFPGSSASMLQTSLGWRLRLVSAGVSTPVFSGLSEGLFGLSNGRRDGRRCQRASQLSRTEEGQEASLPEGRGGRRFSRLLMITWRWAGWCCRMFIGL